MKLQNGVPFSCRNLYAFDMTDLRFDGFDWDEGNSSKNLKKHGIANHLVEALFASGPTVTDDLRHSVNEPRYLAIGCTHEGRWILVCFTLRIKKSLTYIRPISARYMHAKEVRNYEKAQNN